MRPRKYTSHGPTNFLKNTYKILNDESLKAVIRWREDGHSFIIFDIYKFTEQVLPKYFKHNKIESFIRQLNMYGFHKNRNDQAMSLEFFHPQFQKGHEKLLYKIHRKPADNLGSLNREEVSVLMNRLQSFQDQQLVMEEILKNMENQYIHVLQQNQQLISELFQRKQRESQNELFLQNFTQQAKEGAQNIKENVDNLTLWNAEPVYPEVQSGDDVEKLSSEEEYKEKYFNYP